MRYYSIIPKEMYLEQEDNPFRILNLIAMAGLTIKVRKPTDMYPVFETKLKDKFIYIQTDWYHGWSYKVFVDSQEKPYDKEIGYLEAFQSTAIDSEEFYNIFKRLYEEEI